MTEDNEREVTKVVLDLTKRVEKVRPRNETATDKYEMQEDILHQRPLYVCVCVCMHAAFLSQLAQCSVGLVLEVSVPRGRLMPCGLA